MIAYYSNTSVYELVDKFLPKFNYVKSVHSSMPFDMFPIDKRLRLYEEL